MKKYTERQKLDDVETYRSGELGHKKTAALHGVDVASLRKWVPRLLTGSPMRACLLLLRFATGKAADWIAVVAPIRTAVDTTVPVGIAHFASAL